MPYFLIFLLLTACTAPSTSAGTAATNTVETNQPAPPLDVDLSLEAFTNYAKYFEQRPRYPFILLKDGRLTGDKEDQILPIKFKNRGKVLAYTNGVGGVIINDEEILVTADELEKIYDVDLPFFKEQEYPRWNTDIHYQNNLYRYIYDCGLNDLKKIKPLSEGKKYIKSEDVENNPRAYLSYPRVLGYFAQLDLGGDLTSMLLYAVPDEEEQRRTAWYFGYVPDLSQKGDFDYGPMKISPQIRWDKLNKVTAEVLVFDTPEKTHIRMLNLLILNAQGYHYDLIPFKYPGSGDTIMGINWTFRFY